MSNTTLVIMAGGMASRYGSLKQLEKFGRYDELLVDYSIYDAKRAGFNRVVFIIKEFKAISFSLHTALAGSHGFCY